jgi:predicted dehydrogenase
VKPVGVGVIGLGLMGRVHIEAYDAAQRAGHACRLVAVSDRNTSRFDGRAAGGGNLQQDARGKQLFDPRQVATTTDPAALFADESIDLVSICTPTDTHVDLAIAALRAKKHVLVEKPVALDPLAIRRLAAVAREEQRLCMPAMCMRFWPGWSDLLEAARDGRWGRVLTASFQRLGTRPEWGDGFYSDAGRSGGALFDLHIHDVDFVLALCGEPVSVTSAGTLDHVTTIYRYNDGPRHVTAEGGWDQGQGFPFRMRFLVNFESATVEFDSRRDFALEIITKSGVVPVDRPAGTGYDFEIRHVLKSVAERRSRTAVDLADAERVTRILNAEKESLNQRAERSVL